MSEALGSIPSGYPSISSQFCFYHQLLYQQFLPPVIIITKVCITQNKAGFITDCVRGGIACQGLRTNERDCRNGAQLCPGQSEEEVEPGAAEEGDPEELVEAE